MAVKQRDPEDYKLWWPLSLLAAFLLGAWFPMVPLLPKGGLMGIAFLALLVANLALLLYGFRRLLEYNTGSIFTSIILTIAICIGNGVSAWISGMLA